jgi:hypothetical protein
MCYFVPPKKIKIKNKKWTRVDWLGLKFSKSFYILGLYFIFCRLASAPALSSIPERERERERVSYDCGFLEFWAMPFSRREFLKIFFRKFFF